jgi:CRISPR-associated protein Csb3
MLIKADFRNVVDYLAGLGFLEMISWHRNDACARWTDAGIEIEPLEQKLFSDVVQSCRAANVELDVSACKNPESPPKESPLLLTMGDRIIPLNAWLDRLLDRKTIWSPGVSGQVAARAIIEDILQHLKPLCGRASPDLIFSVNEGFAINDCTRFRFDGCIAWTTLDTGFSPNDAGIKIAARPFVEFFAIVGVQCFFPQATGTKGHDPEYCVWDQYLPVSLCRLAARGMVPGHPRHLRGKWLDAGNFGAFSFADES